MFKVGDIVRYKCIEDVSIRLQKRIAIIMEIDEDTYRVRIILSDNTHQYIYSYKWKFEEI